MAKYLDSNGLSHFMGKVKAVFLTGVAWDGTNKKLTQTKNGSTTDVWTPATVASSGSYADLSNKPTIPSAGTGSSYPAMDGERSLGSNSGYARVDHVHPTDTSRAAATHTHAAEDITSGTMDMNRLPVGTSASTVAQGNHAHGNITNGGDITATAPTVASGDKLIINDESASKITNGPAFGTSTTTYLRNDGTWATPPNDSFDPSAELDLTGGWADAQYTQYEIYVSDQEGHEYGNGVILPVMNGSQGGIVTAAILDNYDSKYYAGSGLSMASDHTINHSNSITAGTIGSTSGTSGKTIAVPYATYDAQGHITGKGTHTHTLGDAAVKGVDTSISDGTSSANLPTSAAVSTFVNAMLGDVAGALVYKGTAAAATTITGASYKKGWYWIASAGFDVGGNTVEAGDMIIAKQDKTSTVADDLDVVQTNIETLTTAEIDALWTAA